MSPVCTYIYNSDHVACVPFVRVQRQRYISRVIGTGGVGDFREKKNVPWLVLTPPPRAAPSSDRVKRETGVRRVHDVHETIYHRHCV